MDTGNIIELKGVSFRYNSSVVLERVSFSIKEGEYLGIIGPNGGGKTTLLKIILGLLRPAEGEVSVNLEKKRDWVCAAESLAVSPALSGDGGGDSQKRARRAARAFRLVREKRRGSGG